MNPKPCAIFPRSGETCGLKMLHELQQQMLQGIFAKDPAIHAQVLATESLSSEQHIDIYRGSVLGIHTLALGDVFSVCKKLVGETFFDAMARVYITSHPASSPNLIDYGDDFSGFIEGFKPAQSVPYLADVAALEWAWHRSFYATNPESFDLPAFGAMTPEQQAQACFLLAPGSALLRSDYPIEQIWQVNQDDYAGQDDIELAEGESQLLVWRDDFTVTITKLEPMQWAFLTDVSGGMILQDLVSDHRAELLQQAIANAWIGGFTSCRR